MRKRQPEIHGCQIRRIIVLLLICIMGFVMVFHTPVKVQAKKSNGNGLNAEIQKETKEIASFVKKHWNHLDKKGGDLAKYETCRIVVKSQNLQDDFGASDCLHAEGYGEYILQYSSARETKVAYKKLRKIYKKDCYVDQILDANVLMDLGETQEDITLQEDAMTQADITLQEDAMAQDGIGVEEDITEAPRPTSSQITWGYETMGFANVAADWQEDESATVAIIDTGCDMGNWYFDASRFDARSFDFVEEDSIPQDESSNGHGTHVAGIVSTCTPKQVSLMILRVFDASGGSSVSLIDTALQYAINNHATVINMSLGYEKSTLDEEDVDFWDEDIDQAYAANIPVCCASGNGARKGKGVAYYYPACSDKTISVGSIDSDQNIAATSSQGEALDFSAPGVGIVSALKGGTWDEEAGTWQTKIDSGTSMACPHVTSAFAYLKKNYPNETISQLYDRAKALCVDLGETGHDATFGNGYIHFNCTHQYQIQVVAPTHTTEGYTSYSCSLCGNSRIKYVTPKTAHHFIAYTIDPIQKNGVWQDGLRYEECEECHVRRNEEVIPAPVDNVINAANVVKTYSKVVQVFNLNATCSGGAKLTYQSNNRNIVVNSAGQVTVKAKYIGEAVITIISSATAEYKAAMKQVTVTVTPKKTTVSKVTSPKKRTMKVTWKKNTTASGYQVYCSKTKKFTSNTKALALKGQKKVTVNITKLKSKKKYYVKIRAYKTVSGKKIYGPWSAVKTCKVK
ncbi:MAG: S8 family serine peptidase [Eubacteriales bacterium]|nr:S8 family serine peptidase [Eubacteriales bacterium]